MATIRKVRAAFDDLLQRARGYCLGARSHHGPEADLDVRNTLIGQQTNEPQRGHVVALLISYFCIHKRSCSYRRSEAQCYGSGKDNLEYGSHLLVRPTGEALPTNITTLDTIRPNRHEIESI
jgi:hypothetical protein